MTAVARKIAGLLIPGSARAVGQLKTNKASVKRIAKQQIETPEGMLTKGGQLPKYLNGFLIPKLFVAAAMHFKNGGGYDE